MKYWIKADGNAVSDFHLDISRVFFAEMPDGEGENAHIKLTPDRVIIDDVSMFPGQITPWRAIRWGLYGILRLGPMRRERIKRRFRKRATVTSAARSEYYTMRVGMSRARSQTGHGPQGERTR